MIQDTSRSDSAGDEGTPRLFTKDFILATVINLIMTTAFFTLITGMAVYASAEFNAGETASGFAASAFVVGALCARVFAGKYVNTLGRKLLLVSCMVLYTFCSMAYLWVDSFELLIALRVVHGITLGFGQTALTAAVFDIIPRTRRGEGSGYYLLANSLPPAIGPLLAIQSSERYGFDAMFIAVTLISAAALLGTTVMNVPEVKVRGTPLYDRLRLSPRDIIEPRAFSIAAVAMLIGITFASVMTFLNGFAQSEGYVDAASIYFIVYSVMMLLTRLVMGRVQDRFGDNAVLYPTLVVFIFAMGLLAWTPGAWAIIASGALAGFGFGALLPALQAIIASKLRTHRISIGISTFFIMMDSGFGFAPLVLGPFVESWGYQMMYAACAIVIMVALVLYWLVHGRYDVKQGQARRHQHSWVNDATGVMPTVRSQHEPDPHTGPRSTPSSTPRPTTDHDDGAPSAFTPHL